MPIDPDFPKDYQAIGKHKNADGENYMYGDQEGFLMLQKMKR